MHPLRGKNALDMYDLFWDSYKGFLPGDWVSECLVLIGRLE